MLREVLVDGLWVGGWGCLAVAAWLRLPEAGLAVAGCGLLASAVVMALTEAPS